MFEPTEEERPPRSTWLDPASPRLLKHVAALFAVSLEATCVLVLVRGESTLDRIPHHRDELDGWQVTRKPVNSEGVVQVVPAGLERDRPAVTGRPQARGLGNREMAAVPICPTVIVQVEVVDSLVERRADHLRAVSAWNSEVVPQRWAPITMNPGSRRSGAVAVHTHR